MEFSEFQLKAALTAKAPGILKLNVLTKRKLVDIKCTTEDNSPMVKNKGNEMNFPSAYERTANKILEGNISEKRRPVARFVDGKLSVGTCSLHRTRASRVWRMFNRMKTVKV